MHAIEQTSDGFFVGLCGEADSPGIERRLDVLLDCVGISQTAAFLDLKPGQCMMVAAHNGDLLAARGRGFHTAFVSRPLEHGPNKTRDVRAEHDFDVIAEDFIDLAAKLGC